MRFHDYLEDLKKLGWRDDNGPMHAKARELWAEAFPWAVEHERELERREAYYEKRLQRLVFSETPPDRTGWYFKRHQKAISVQHVVSAPLPHWTAYKHAMLNQVKHDPNELARVKAIPDSDWIVEWAGPIVMPEGCE